MKSFLQVNRLFILFFYNWSIYSFKYLFLIVTLIQHSTLKTSISNTCLSMTCTCLATENKENINLIMVMSLLFFLWSPSRFLFLNPQCLEKSWHVTYLLQYQSWDHKLEFVVIIQWYRLDFYEVGQNWVKEWEFNAKQVTSRFIQQVVQ